MDISFNLIFSNCGQDFQDVHDSVVLTISDLGNVHVVSSLDTRTNINRSNSPRDMVSITHDIVTVSSCYGL